MRTDNKRQWERKGRNGGVEEKMLRKKEEERLDRKKALERWKYKMKK